MNPIHSDLSSREYEQYKPHLLLDKIGIAGQKKLKQAKVLCVGAGGLGSPLLFYLAGAGVGTIGIIDPDDVEVSNLQRQILFTTRDVGKKKAAVAQERLQHLNPHVDFKIYPKRLTIENAKEILKDYDIITDGSDNFETRYLVNHTCLALKKVNVSASVSEFKGHCTIFVPDKGPCYHCLFPANQGEEQLSNCRERGILGVLPGILGAFQAAEVIKWILGLGTPLVGKLLQVDVLNLAHKIYAFDKDPACAICGPKELPPFSYRCVSDCHLEWTIAAEELKKLLREKSIFLIDVREQEEHAYFNVGGVNIPLSQLAEKQAEWPKDQPIVTYCQSGRRSEQAAQILKKNGFSDVKTLKGGVDAWDGKVLG